MWFVLVMLLAHFVIGGHIGGVIVFTTFLMAAVSILISDNSVQKHAPEENAQLDVFFNVVASQAVMLCALFLVVWHDGTVLLPAVFIAICEVAQLQMFMFTGHDVEEEGNALIANIGRFVVALAIAGFLAIPLLSLESALWFLDGPATILFWLVGILSVLVFLIQTRAVFKI